MFSINLVSKFIRNIQFQEKIEGRGCNECTTVDKQKRARNNLSRGMVNAGFIDAHVHDDLRVWLYEFPAGGKYDTNKNNGTKVSRSRGKEINTLSTKLCANEKLMLPFYT